MTAAFALEDLVYRFGSVMALANEQLCFQPGVRTEDVAVYEAWSCVPLEPDR